MKIHEAWEDLMEWLSVESRREPIQSYRNVLDKMEELELGLE